MVWNRKTPGHGGRTTDHKSAQWGGVNYGKPTAEFNAHKQKVMVETRGVWINQEKNHHEFGTHEIGRDITKSAEAFRSNYYTESKL